jgi:flagellar biosynthetic protein FliQ
MGPDYFIDVAQDALWVLVLVVSPIILPALGVGVLLGMVQAATSINEQTLSFVPKLLVVLLCLALFGSLMMGMMMDFVVDIFGRIPDLVR